MKSILFTHLREELLSGVKVTTSRTTFQPNYFEEDIVNIDFKYENQIRERLFEAEIIKIYPKQIKDYSLEEALKDGFKSVKEFQEGIMEINKIKRIDHWSFITEFKRTSDLILEFIYIPVHLQNQQLTTWMGGKT
jgi:hypothetical protein